MGWREYLVFQRKPRILLNHVMDSSPAGVSAPAKFRGENTHQLRLSDSPPPGDSTNTKAVPILRSQQHTETTTPYSDPPTPPMHHKSYPRYVDHKEVEGISEHASHTPLSGWHPLSSDFPAIAGRLCPCRLDAGLPCTGIALTVLSSIHFSKALHRIRY